jgi:hypothetical protein
MAMIRDYLYLLYECSWWKSGDSNPRLIRFEWEWSFNWRKEDLFQLDRDHED